MKKCTCYCIDEAYRRNNQMQCFDIIRTARCNGTKERDVCNCEGEENKCDFYPNKQRQTIRQRDEKMHNNDCTICNGDYRTEIKALVTRYHSSDTTTQELMECAYCPFCGKKLV